ncbi:hypothetical protein [Absidia glauca]|uniref:Uncharacterized protein n=1 Tax=Absidia glauca TaxID=4829 RepID=A0A163KV20_ABSGL|nr:hypothetical protein [Absidia glauca]
MPVSSTGRGYVAYGSILIRGLTKHHRSLVKQIKATHAATDPTHNLSINVAYVTRVIPSLYIEDFDNDRSSLAARRATRFGNGNDTNRHDNYANNRGRPYQNGRGCQEPGLTSDLKLCYHLAPSGLASSPFLALALYY